MSILTAAIVFRNYEVDGVPDSGAHDPKKGEIIQLLDQIQGTSSAPAVVRQTRAALDAVTPVSENYGGLVLNDPDPTKNGYYYRAAGVWVWGRGLPDTFARVTLSGSENAQVGAIAAGVNPADIEVFFAPVTTENTGAMTLTIGGVSRAVVNVAGNPLAAGEWTGGVLFYLNGDGVYQMMNDAGAALSAAASATQAETEANRAEFEADRAEAAAALSGPTGVFSGVLSGDGATKSFSMPAEPATQAHLFIAILGILQAPATYSFSGTALTFSQAPPAGTDNISYRIISLSEGEDVPPNGSVTKAKMAASAIGDDEIDGSEAAAIRTKLGLGTGQSPNFAGLTVGGVPVATTAPPVSFASHKNGTAQASIASATPTKITFPTERWDQGGFFDAANSRWTPPAGRYRVSAGLYFTAGVVATEEFGVEIRVNGTLARGGYLRAPSTAGIQPQISTVIELNGTDYVEVFGTGGGTGTKTVSGTSSITLFEGEAI